MKRFLSLASLLALCSALPVASLAQSSPAPALAPATVLRTLTIPLRSQNESGETGTATFVQSGPDLLVSVRVNNAPSDVQPAHIHKGTCLILDPKVSYPFPAIANRRSQTKIPNLTIAQLMASPYSVNVHKSAKEAAIYAACGEIKPS